MKEGKGCLTECGGGTKFTVFGESWEAVVQEQVGPLEGTKGGSGTAVTVSAGGGGRDGRGGTLSATRATRRQDAGAPGHARNSLHGEGPGAAAFAGGAGGGRKATLVALRSWPPLPSILPQDRRNSRGKSGPFPRHRRGESPGEAMARKRGRSAVGDVRDFYQGTHSTLCTHLSKANRATELVFEFHGHSFT
jgi:hypothetical protein